MLEVLLVLVSIAFLITLAMLMKGRKETVAASPKAVDDTTRLRSLEGELDKKRKELEETRRSQSELKDELKQIKKKLHEEREADKENRDLARARQEAERSASVQLEVTRGELAAALVEIDRLKSEGGRPRRPVPAPAITHSEAAAPVPAPAPVVEAPRPPPQRVIRELSPADKEKMDRAEHEAKRARQRASELENEVRRLKSKVETDKRVYVVTKGELDLLKDKYKAIEKRMNRALLQADLARRAVKDLEKKTGIAAERTELTAEEGAASDRQVEERVTAEQAQDQKRHDEQLKAAEAAAAATAPAAAAPDTTAEKPAEGEAAAPPSDEPSAQA